MYWSHCSNPVRGTEVPDRKRAFQKKQATSMTRGKTPHNPDDDRNESRQSRKSNHQHVVDTPVPGPSCYTRVRYVLVLGSIGTK